MPIDPITMVMASSEAETAKPEQAVSTEPEKPVEGSSTSDSETIATSEKPNQGTSELEAQLAQSQKELENERRRRQGLDRKLSRLQRRGQERAVSEEERETLSKSGYVQDLEDYKAQTELANEMETLLKEYPNIPEVAQNILRDNPMSAVKTAKDIDGALLEMESYIINLSRKYPVQQETTTEEDKPQTSTPNVPSTDDKPDLSTKTSAELLQMLADGKITDKDMEKAIRESQKG